MTRPKDLRQRRRQAIWSAAGSGVWLVLSGTFFLWLRRAASPGPLLGTILLVLAVAHAVMLVPLAYSLRERLKEIQGGEEDEARQY